LTARAKGIDLHHTNSNQENEPPPKTLLGRWLYAGRRMDAWEHTAEPATHP